MKLSRISPGSYYSNCYIISDGDEAVVIDPSAPYISIARALAMDKLRPVAIVLTHGHFDHMLGLEHFRTANPDVPVMIHANDAEMISDGKKNASFELLGASTEFTAPDRRLVSGDTIKFGQKTLNVLHTPGHTNGSVCYQVGNLLFTGDTIMENGYGRYDLYGGDPEKLKHSLLRLSSLSQKENYIIYPGHGKHAKLSDAIFNIYNH